MRLALISLETNHLKGGAAMNRLTILLFVLSVASVLVASQVFSASSGYGLNSDPLYRSDSPELMKSDATPIATCEVEHRGSGHSDMIMGQAEGYPENTEVASSCEGVGLDVRAKDLNAPNTMDSWIYR
jgi:hypothetical protein